jgi:hypothetical protein
VIDPDVLDATETLQWARTNILIVRRDCWRRGHATHPATEQAENYYWTSRSAVLESLSPKQRRQVLKRLTKRPYDLVMLHNL